MFISSCRCFIFTFYIILHICSMWYMRVQQLCSYFYWYHRSLGLARSCFKKLTWATAAGHCIGNTSGLVLFLSPPNFSMFKLGGPSESAAHQIIAFYYIFSHGELQNHKLEANINFFGQS